MIAMNEATATRVEAHLGLLADRIEEEALLSHPFPSEEIAEAIGQGNAVRRLARSGLRADQLFVRFVAAVGP